MVEVVDADLFVPDAWHTMRSETTSRVQRIFGDLGDDWLSATDEFYLLQRMRNWAGSRYSAAGLDRRILAPFFHPEFVAWARGVPRRDKSGSRAMARTIQRLDGELAEIRLEHGESPAAIAGGGASLRVREAERFVAKGLRKVRHRLERTGNAPNSVRRSPSSSFRAGRKIRRLCADSRHSTSSTTNASIASHPESNGLVRRRSDFSSTSTP